MTDFSRRARWLNALFPASRAPQVTDPGNRSDDVSLVQQYDSGGLAIARASSAFIVHTTATGASGTETIISATETEVIRCIAAHINLAAGTIPASAHLVVRESVGNLDVLVSRRAPTLAVGAGSVICEPFRQVVLIPGTDLRISWDGGTAPTSVRCRVYFIRAPAGTVFHF